jgi:hypothetical protein
MQVEVGKPGRKCSWLVGNDPIPTVSASILEENPDELWHTTKEAVHHRLAFSLPLTTSTRYIERNCIA